MLLTFYRIFYHFIHFVSTVIECVASVVFNLSKFEHGNILWNELFKSNKTPQHLTVIFNSGNCCLQDIANIVKWCCLTNIPYVSFYDYKGELRKQEDELKYLVSEIKDKNDQVIWHLDKTEYSTIKNGFLGNKIHVKILTEAHGKQAIVNLTKNLIKEGCKSPNIDLINSRLVADYEFPDPDMGMVIGDNFKLGRYPCWQIRVTEFFRVKSIRNLSLNVFLGLLLKFGKCEQRLGK